MAGARIREVVVPADLATVRELFEEYAAGLGVDLCFQGFAAELAGLPGDYSPPGGGLWLAETDGQAAGCVALRVQADGLGEMKRLYVRPAFRKAKLGRALTEHVLREAAGRGHRSVCLDTLPSMVEAIALYRSLGFTETAPYRANPVPGALYLGKTLALPE